MRSALPFVFLVACTSDGSSGPPAEVGDPAPEFSLLDVEGTTHALSDYSGDLVVVDLSAMWCSTCQDSADELERLHTTYGSDGVTVITVIYNDYDGNEDVSSTDLQDWVGAFDLTHLVLADEGEQTWEAWNLDGGRPTFAIVERNGEVGWKGRGGRGRAQLEDEILDRL